jgi:hypothetical protein
LLLLAMPADWKLLGTQPMSPEQIWLLLIATLAALALIHLLNRLRKLKEYS